MIRDLGRDSGSLDTFVVLPADPALDERPGVPFKVATTTGRVP